MKLCPTCKRSYEDDSLRYCLEDGTPLTDQSVGRPDSERTLVLPSASAGVAPTQQGRFPGNATVPAAQSQTPFAPPYAPTSRKPRVWPWIVGGLGALFLVIAVIGLVVAIPAMFRLAENDNRPIVTTTPGFSASPSASPSPVLMYARDFLKSQLGPFSLVKSHDKEETRKTATGFAAKLIDQSNDAAAAEYKSSSVRSVIFMACSYSNPTTPASLVDEIETDMRGSSAWRTVTNVPRQNGKRIDAEDSNGNGLVIWCNGYWVFLTIGDSLSDAKSMADNVGY